MAGWTVAPLDEKLAQELVALKVVLRGEMTAGQKAGTMDDWMVD